MKKSFFVILTVLLLLFTGMVLTAQEEEEYQMSEPSQDWMSNSQRRIPRILLCSEITPEILKEAKASIKKIKEGVVISFQSADPATLQAIKEAIAACKAKTGPHDLISMPGVAMTVTDLEGGIQMQLTSTDKKVVKKIKRVTVKAPPKKNPGKK